MGTLPDFLSVRTINSLHGWVATLLTFRSSPSFLGSRATKEGADLQAQSMSMTNHTPAGVLLLRMLGRTPGQRGQVVIHRLCSHSHCVGHTAAFQAVRPFLCLLSGHQRRMDRLNASLISCLDGFGCINIFQNWLPGAIGEDVVLNNRRFRVVKLVSSQKPACKVFPCSGGF